MRSASSVRGAGQIAAVNAPSTSLNGIVLVVDSMSTDDLGTLILYYTIRYDLLASSEFRSARTIATLTSHLAGIRTTD
jgi:hypothetical protein